jgi:hypothetical protein
LDFTPSPSAAEPDNPIQRIAREKAGVAWRELKSAIDKHQHDGLAFVLPDDQHTRIVIRGLGGIEAVSAIHTRDGPDVLEARFRERYERQEQIEYARRSKKASVPSGEAAGVVTR